MYAISSDNGRRGSPTGPQRPELPILFHLVDVSRPRPAADGLAAPTGRAQSQEKGVVPPTIAAATATTGPAASPFDTKPLATLTMPAPTAPAFSAARTETVAAEVIEPHHELLAAAAKAASQSPGDVKLVAPPVEEPILLEVAEPASQTAATVTLKTKAAESKAAERRQRRTPASEDWFASHGKFIALAFVAALIGTVYFARTSRQQAAPEKTAGATQSPLVEIRPAESPSEGTSKGVQMVAAVSDSKVELQPPSAPPLISSASAEKPAGGDKLFDFPATAKAEQRVAAKPSTNSELKYDSSPPASDSTTGAPALAPAYPVTTSPAAYPSAGTTPSGYPQTAAPALPSAPALQGPANAAPNYRSQFPTQSSPPVAPPPAAPQQGPPSTGWSPPMGAAPSQYQPMNNTARGQRYEFTGSGRY